MKATCSDLLLIVLALNLPLAAPAQSRSYLATVVHVTDGDTVWVRPSWGGRSIQVRIQGIDAPETCQPFGARASQALRQRLLRQTVKVEEHGRDDYRRTLARLQWSGQDVGRWLVSSGLAWSYRYRRDPGPYAGLQAQARQARRGLWSERQPIEPARFRKLHGSCQCKSRAERGCTRLATIARMSVPLPSSLEAPLRPVGGRPDGRFLLSHPAHLIALGFGCGLSPVRARHRRHAVGLGLVPGAAGLAAAGRHRLGGRWPACRSAGGPAPSPRATWAWPTPAPSSGTRSWPSGWCCGC